MRYERITRKLKGELIESLIKSPHFNINDLAVESDKMIDCWTFLSKSEPYFGYSLEKTETGEFYEFFSN
jgi:hypothetical protein